MKLLYLDTSALFKRYVEEHESEEVLERIEEAPAVGTAMITQVEVAAALAQAVRQQRMGRNEAQEAEQEFLDDWDDFTRIGVTGRLAALAWQDTFEDAEDKIVFACFDNDLRRAATAAGLETWPE